MSRFFAPMTDQTSDIMQPIDPLFTMERGYGRGLGAAPIDPLIPQDIGTPVVHMFDTAHQYPSGSLQLHGVSEVMDVFNMARFLFEEGR